ARPILRVDSAEHWPPLNTDRLLSERTLKAGPRHRVCVLSGPDTQNDNQCEPLAGSADLADEQSAARVIDFAGRQLNGSDYRSPTLSACPAPQPAQLYDCDRGAASAMYYRVTN